MLKITREQWIAKTEEFLGRPMTETELASIEKCDCPKDYCSGWTAEISVPSMFFATPTYEV